MNSKGKFMSKLAAQYFLILVLTSCAQVTSLNLKKHQFGQLPTKIIWLQVAGLNEEHLALLKYSQQTSGTKTSFEEFLCIGKAWDYNLYQIRPDAFASFMGQLTGKKNIKNSCDDYQLKPIWQYMLTQGYKIGVFEGEMSAHNSILKAQACQNEDSPFLKGLTIWKMDKKVSKDKAFFHINERTDYKASEIYYDKSCLTGDCFSTLSQNVINTYEQFTRKNPNYLYLIRDFQFLDSLSKANVNEMRNSLLELEKIILYFQNIANRSSDVLLLLTTAENRNVEFPLAGKKWEEFEKTGKGFINKNAQLISTVLASGARAENFCGVYDQSDILSRIFSGPKQQGLELTIINPFDQ
jgi:hypothetical protein